MNKNSCISVNMKRAVKFYKKVKGECRYFDFTGYYEVDENGIIESCDRYVKHPKGGLSLKKGKQCDYKIGTNGYSLVSLSKAPINGWFSVAQIVSQAFPEICGEWFEGCDVDHRNTIRTDNRAENIRICSRKDNLNNPLTKQHMSEKQMGKTPWNKGKNNEYHINAPIRGDGWAEWRKRAVIGTDKNGTEIEYGSLAEASKATGAMPPNIIKCCNGKYTQSGGYKWRYKQ